MTVDLSLLKMTVTSNEEQQKIITVQQDTEMATSSTPATSSTTTTTTATGNSRPKFMITDILRPDASPASQATAAPHGYPPLPPPAPLAGSHQHFYNFMAAAAYGFNPAAMAVMPGMLPLLVPPTPVHHHHPARPNSAESSPRDLSFKRTGDEEEDEDEEEFVDPDGSTSDHEGHHHHNHLSDDDSDICKPSSQLTVSIMRISLSHLTRIIQ